jgi:TaqI-like C-terminal specificity domain
MAQTLLDVRSASVAADGPSASPRAHFTKDNWIIEPPAVVALFNKIKSTGITLSEHVGTAPMYGVKTGFNQAFLIESSTRQRLVTEHRSAQDIIRPYLRGQDVARWQSVNPDLWMIFARRGIDIDAYPSVKRHLETYHARLQPRPDDWKPSRPGEKWSGRKKGTYAWYELQDAVDYWQEFSKPKIIYKVIQFYASYAFDAEGRLGNDKTFIIPTDDPSLLVILNSPLMWWFNWRHLTHLKDEALSPMGYKMERLPIAPFDRAAKDLAARLVRELIAETNAVRASVTSISDWLRHTLGITRPSRALLDFDSPTPDSFVTAVQNAVPRRRRLTASNITELKREYNATIEPARASRRTIFGLEQRISELVNSAYRLTPEEIALLWETAPPRMPFTPHGLSVEEATPDEAEDDD